MYTVYVLKSLKDGKRYIGYTNDLVRRLKEHNAGRTTSTKNRRPFELVYHVSFDDKREAERYEKFLKSGQGREVLKALEIGAVPNPPQAG